jgi:hypothetical protein
MGWNICGDGCGHRHRGNEKEHKEKEIQVVVYENPIVNFLRTLSPGIQVELQYDCQPPACGTFQGFENGNVILTNYNGFPGLVRIAPNRINAVAPFGYGKCKKH